MVKLPACDNPPYLLSGLSIESNSLLTWSLIFLSCFFKPDTSVEDRAQAESFFKSEFNKICNFKILLHWIANERSLLSNIVIKSPSGRIIIVKWVQRCGIET